MVIQSTWVPVEFTRTYVRRSPSNGIFSPRYSWSNDNDNFEFKEINDKTETLSLKEIKDKLLNVRNLN